MVDVMIKRKERPDPAPTPRRASDGSGWHVFVSGLRPESAPDPSVLQNGSCGSCNRVPSEARSFSPTLRSRCAARSQRRAYSSEPGPDARKLQGGSPDPSLAAR